MRTRAQSAEPAALDVPYLATAFGVAESDVQALIDAPTVELVQDFLTTLIGKGQEFEALKADKLKADVELESTIRTSETKLKAQKATVTKHAKEVEELRTKLSEAESARETLSSELEELRSSSSGSTAETQALKTRIDTLEASNRDALGLVESKTTEKDRIAAELSEQHGKLLALRREISQLEERNQGLENAASSQKFKEQSLQQELDLAKRNNEWHAKELKTRNEESTKFRKERNARIASLQRELEDANANVDTLKRTETNLRQRLDEVQAKADDAFSRIASLEEESTRKEQGWNTELAGSKRLAELQAQNAATHKARLQEVERQLDEVRDDARDEIGRLQAEIETERADKEQAESKVAELELTVEKLEQQPRASRPGTPMHNGALDLSTPGRVGSPFALGASARKSGRPMTNTEYVATINALREDLESERRRTKDLSDGIDDMLNKIETRAPEIQELKDEQGRLEDEVLTVSRLLEDANSARDKAIREIEQWQSAAESKAREGDILRQQVRDNSAQVKMLLVEIQSRDQGLGGLSGQERFELEKLARGELETWSENETMTNQLISNNLVIFHNVAELQEKNEQLLRVTRELGEKMEGEEARKKAAESEANAAEVEELRRQIARYKDEMQSTTTQITSYVKERDMFRRMLQHRGHMNPDADQQAMFGQSLPPATPQRNGSEVPPTPRSKEVEELNKLLKEQQTFFDQFRNETAQDRSMLKEQADSLGREKNTLQAEVAHWRSQKTLVDERLQMLQTNYNGLRSENLELQKRSQDMAENAAKQDLRTQQVAEDLVEARSMAESLRNENANSKAEKELWKRIEARLTEDNKGLMDERSRLNNLVTDLQKLQNERELSDSESRRRLQARTESLETELADTKKKLELEVDDSRSAKLRREYEEGQSRTRIDDLVKSLGNTRESLVAAETERNQYQSRVEELKIELRASEEKNAALQPRPTPRAEPQQNGEPQAEGEDEELSAEQRLALENTDLRRELELKKNQLESANQQVDQYKNIAQSSEEELANLNETSELYKEDVDRQIAEKDGRVSELQQRIDDLQTELTTTNNELSELRSKQDDSSRMINEQKASFEVEITRLKDDAERYGEEKKLYHEDLKAQAEIAQQAQQSYEDELLKHAEAAKTLQNVRKEHNDLRTEVTGIRAEAEVAKASLERGEESWSDQRGRFEKEIQELKTRRQEIDEQNKLLHQQMESFSSELNALRSRRAVPAAEGEERASTPTGDSNLQEVIKYLRREKDIVDVQYELSVQESKRLQQQLDYANTQLEETRQKLAEERRQASDNLASEGSTQKLRQTIDELNLFRESSTTLRNEARQAREKLEERSKEVERLLSEIEPLKSRVGELEGDVEGKDGEIKLLQDDRDHWRERAHNIISKYDRVDPAEIESMKNQLEELRVEKERLEAEQAPLHEQVNNIDEKVKLAVEENSQAFQTRLDKIRDQAKEQNRKQVARIRETETAIETANAEKAKVEQDLQAAMTELETTKTALQEAQGGGSRAQNEEGEVNENASTTDDSAALRTKLAEAESSAFQHSSRAEMLSTEVQTLQARVQELEEQVSTLQQSLNNALQGEEGEIQSDPTDPEEMTKLRQELADARTEVDTLRAKKLDAAESTQLVTQAQPAEGEQSVAAQVAVEVAKLRVEIEQQHELAKKQLEDERDKRLENMKQSLRNKLKEERDKMRETVRQELLVQHEAEKEKLNMEHEANINLLKAEHQEELDKLTKEGGAAVAKAEGGSPPVKGDTSAEAEWPTEQQVLELMKTNARIKGIVSNNINKRVAGEKEEFQRSMKEKEEELARLRAAQSAAPGDEEELRKKLAAAEEDKNQAVLKAVENETKKVRVQLSQRDIAQAKIAVVRKAAQETPEKTVKEVWEVADKARPAPKPAAPAASSPATAAPKSAVPPSPTQAQAPRQASPFAPVAAQTQVQRPSSPFAPAPQSQELSEEEKLKQRQQRFGTQPTASTQAQQPAATGTFGQPSFPSGIQPSTTTPNTFGQPSQTGTGALAQPARRMSSAGPNPQAPAFNPNANADAPASQLGRRTSQQSLGRGGIPQPRGGATVARGGGDIAVQGAAGAQQTQATGAARGTGIPRGGAPRGRGGIPRGGALNTAGQKRPHEGGDGGDGKRARGGGPGGA